MNPREGVSAMYEGYCVKCKEKREFEGEVVTLKNGRPAAKGICTVCGTKIMKFLKKDAVEQAPEAGE
jgi:hypothetical protein